MATANPTTPQSAYPGMPRSPMIPSNIINSKLMSQTSVAADCFVYQRFSNRLQSYLIDYVNNIYSEYPRYH